MIKFVLMVNKQGQTRLAQYYDFLSIQERVAGLICLGRNETQCSFVEYRGYKVIYRRYASLFFIVGVKDDDSENELGILEFIHALVETMDKYFESVIMFNLEKAHFILDEMVMNGYIVETNKISILKPIHLMEKASPVATTFDYLYLHSARYQIDLTSFAIFLHLSTMTRVNEKIRLLPAVQAIYSSASGKLKTKRCLIIAAIVTPVAVAGLSVWWLFFDDHESTGSDEVICGDTKNEAGYIKLPNKNDDQYFYWFFEAKHNASTAPLVIWLTGGPGGSSLLALFNENGPCRIQPDLTTKVHPYSWTYEANMIWLDQPTSVGFSYSSGDDHDYNERDVGENLYWFLQGFIEKHPEFDGREFFLMGESYGGHYVPGAAHYIWEQNKKNESSVMRNINLQGIAIGNGWTNPVVQHLHAGDMLDNSYNITLLDEAAAEQLKIDTVKCAELTRECQQSPSESSCLEPYEYCVEHLVLALSANSTGRNPYDVRETCDW
ncbi:Serine protease family S10, partial [Phytophthora palmivora]